MRKHAAAIAVIGAVLSVSASAAQIVSHIDNRGRRVYVNAEEPPAKPVPLPKKKGSRHSILVRRDAKTNQLVSVPAREAAEAAPPAVIAPSGPTDAGAGRMIGARDAGAGRMIAATDAGSRKTPEPPADTPQPASYSAEERAYSHGFDRGLSLWNGMDVLIQSAAERHEVDPQLVRAIIKVESNFNPYAISHKGAMGLMQLIPKTARQLGVNDAFDPEQNVDGGVRHLKYLLEQYRGNLPLSLAAYNAGEGAVERYNGIPPYQETRQYVRRIASLYRGGLISAPFGPLFHKSGAQQPDRWGIMKHVDEKGRVHFSNTEGW